MGPIFSRLSGRAWLFWISTPTSLLPLAGHNAAALYEWIPCILEPDKDSKEYRKNWARLIQKIYEEDPLTCPKCFGKMKIICVIEVFSRPPRLSDSDNRQI